ncbi:hypothetical protein QBC47DRAFT_424754 [Echria macrotheca]|uniref:Uncharacterized protein n=1 Tax=Echria macrotheca TaxID=438768 RepID=A0AAJ0F8W4_9PEZI|nr:hypothetical protein QBC47DRAFT_424754 [Echria macrotheca]
MATRIPITKPRAKVHVVKPILKKLSHSEKNSLDLDRGWDEQVAADHGSSASMGWGGGHYGSRSSSTRDVSFGGFTGAFGPGGDASGASASAAGAAGALITTAGAGGAGAATSSSSTTAATRKFTHGRSASQASTGSTSRGAFVHPFQQTPRTSTPPLSYANSLASFDNARDYSPTITENEDDDQLTHPLHHHHHHHQLPPSLSQSNIRRPSLASSQRTSSFTDISAAAGAPPLRVSTGGKSVPALVSRLAHGSSLTATASHSDLHLDLSLDSPGTFPQPSIASPTSSVSVAPMSPLRSSLEGVGFPRLRSRSELDTAARAENIREARRKFEERERVKEEKYAREMIRKRERRDAKEAIRIEKGVSARKGSMGDVEYPPTSFQAPSQRPPASRKHTPTNLSAASAPAAVGNLSSGGLSLGGKGFWTGNNSRDALAGYGKHDNNEITTEKQPMDFASRQYESVPDGETPPPAFGQTPLTGASGVRFEQARPRRGSAAKRKTQSYWQGFILWLRTKILRISGK